MCLHHADINSDPAKKIYQTEVDITNRTNQTIIYPSTSSVAISVNGIMPGVPGGERTSYRKHIIGLSI